MFIVIEGCEGAGKSSLAKLLKERLLSQGKDVVATREPGGSGLGEQLRNFILESSIPTSPYVELFLFLAARAQHIEEVILPALSSGKVVICERFHDSTIVYQGIGEGLGKEYVANLCYHVVGEDTLTPDLTCLLDIPSSEGLARKQKQKFLDKFEDKPLEYHIRIREGFLSLAQDAPEKYLVLDGMSSIENVVNQVLAAYAEFSVCK